MALFKKRVLILLFPLLVGFLPGACAQFQAGGGLYYLRELLDVLNTNPGILFSQNLTATSFTEGGATDSYALVLNSQPQADVTITVNPGAQIDVNGSATPITLTFTPANWSTPQIVTVQALDDILIEGAHSGSIQHTVTSSDPDYSSLTLSSFAFTITDNDNPGDTTGTDGSDTNYHNIGGATFTPGDASEVWLWFVTFALKSDTAQSNNDTTSLAQITVNGLTDLELEQQSNEGNHYKMMVAMGAITGVATEQTIALEMKSAQMGTVTTVRDLRIVTVKLPTGSDFHYAADSTEVTTTANWTTISSPQLTINPTSPGDYFILAFGQHHENPSTSTSELRLDLSGATSGVWPDVSGGGFYSGNPRGAYDTFFVVRKVNLAASAHTLNFQFRSSGGGVENSSYRNLRMLAFRADAFELIESQEDFAPTSTTSTTAVAKSTLTTSAPPDYRDYLILQSMYLYDTDVGATHQELGSFTQDGATLSEQDHVLDRGEEYQFASGCIQSLNSNTSHTFVNNYWTNDAGIATFAKESVIYVLRFNP